MKILIVEDELISRQIIKKIAEPYGECDIAVNGVEAIELFQNSVNEEEFYNVIFLDIMLPEMDGYSVLKNIREIEESANLPLLEKTKIVMTTSLEESKNIIEAFKEQCDYYIVKPVDRSEVNSILDNI